MKTPKNKPFKLRLTLAEKIAAKQTMKSGLSTQKIIAARHGGGVWWLGWKTAIREMLTQLHFAKHEVRYRRLLARCNQSDAASPIRANSRNPRKTSRL